MRNENNAAFSGALANVSLAISTLTAQRINVININLCQPSTPTINVEYSPALLRFITERIAVYYAFGCKERGKYKQAQYKLCGCRVVWTEYH